MAEPGQKYAQYQIISRLGAGGMGEVYLAEDTRLGRQAALKFLAAEFASHPDHRGRFFREARAASSLNHPNICTIYDIDDSAASPFIAMEFIEGETLAEVIARHRLGVRKATDIARQIGSALAEAHAAGVIHRDVKPANIIVTMRGKAKILDFGLAKQVDKDLAKKQFSTSAGMILGTASYMSPEQARGHETDAATDVWSLGVCLYEMLVGEHPFVGDTATDTLAAILTRTPPPPSGRFAEIPAALDAIVMKSLKRVRAERFNDAGEMLKALDRFDSTGGARSTGRIDPNTGEERTHIFDSAPTEVANRRVTGVELVDPSKKSNNLSRRFAAIIGREDEIAAVSRLILDESARIVSLTGIGGTGKTKLAQAVAIELLPDFADGVFFVELGGISELDLVAANIASTLGVKDTGGRSIADLLSEYLREKQMLLVLDNFEQVIEAAPLLAELSAACERLQFLVTSRILLRLSSEREFAVPPLTAPANEDAPIDEIASSDAIKLFVTRASAASADFVLDDRNAHDVAAICRRLEGLPLAIELAAARIKILEPNDILKRLDDRLKFLTGGPRDLPARQRTMHGAVDWSYGLLSASDQDAFRKLSVFAAGFRLEAAEAVLGDDIDVLEAISTLLDQSLLLRREHAGGQRFQMLDVVRDFAFATLDAQGDLDATRSRHADYFVSLAEKAEPFLQAARSADWLNRLEDEHDNIRAAMDWSLKNDPDRAVRLAVAVRNFWLLHSHLGEGYRWLKAALESGGSQPVTLRFKLMNGLGLASRFRGDLETAHVAYQNGLAAGIEAGDKHGIAVSSRGLGQVSMELGDIDASRNYFQSGLEISRELGDKFGTALSLSFLGDLERTAGDDKAARPLFEEALIYFKDLDNKSAAADALNNLAAAEFGIGDFRAAGAHFAEAAALAGTLGNKMTISCSLDGFAALATAAGNLKTAARLSGAAEYTRESIGYKIEPAERRFRHGYLSRLEKLLAPDDFKSEAAFGREMPWEKAIELAINLNDERSALLPE